MFNSNTTASQQDLDPSSSNQQVLQGWSGYLGRFDQEYERFAAIDSEQCFGLQPLPLNMAAGFTC